MLAEELSKYIGQTIIIFTVSGGSTGQGFSGVLLRVNTDFITLVNRLGTPPNCQSEELSSLSSSDGDSQTDYPLYIVNSLCDIRINKIVAFCHNMLY